MLHESLDQIRGIADHDVPRGLAQQTIDTLRDTVGKVSGHDPNGSSTSLGDAINAFEAAIRLVEEALAVMNEGGEHLYTAANNV